MNDEIPTVQCKYSSNEKIGFVINTFEKIKNHKEEYNYDPEKAHKIKFYTLIFFTNGESKQLVDFKWHPVQKNSLVYLCKEQINAFKFSKGLEGFCLSFNQEYFTKCCSLLSKDFVFRFFVPQLFSPILQIPKESDFRNYFELLSKEYADSNSLNKETIIESLLIILLTKAEQIKQTQSFYTKDVSKMKYLLSFMTLLEENFNKSRSADYYANKLAITYKHLNLICKELINKTAKTFIDEFVILEAKRKLLNSEIKSTELAYLMGFEDPTNFSKYFKKMTGLTPNSFKTKYI